MIASGNLDAPIQITERDEIGALAGSLNGMRESIKNLIGELRESNEKLEDYGRTLELKVDERTKELEQAVREIGKARTRLVDDHDDLWRIVKDRLTNAGFEVIEAATGEAGIEAAEKERPDLILMDMQLPGFDGYETTRRIRTDPMMQGIPIIAVTSFALPGDEAKAMQVLEAAAKRAASFDPQKLRDALASIKVDTVMGPWEVDETGFMSIEPTISQIQNGQRVIVWPADMAEAKFIAMPPWKDR